MVLRPFFESRLKQNTAKLFFLFVFLSQTGRQEPGRNRKASQKKTDVTLLCCKKRLESRVVSSIQVTPHIESRKNHHQSGYARSRERLLKSSANATSATAFTAACRARGHDEPAPRDLCAHAGPEAGAVSGLLVPRRARKGLAGRGRTGRATKSQPRALKRGPPRT